MLMRLRRERGVGLKQLVNEGLHRGLSQMAAKPQRRPHFQTRSVDAGRVLVESIDNIDEALAIAEGKASA